MASSKRAPGLDRLGGAQPPSSGGYGDIDESAQQVGESDAPDVKEQEPPNPALAITHLEYTAHPSTNAPLESTARSCEGKRLACTGVSR